MHVQYYETLQVPSVVNCAGSGSREGECILGVKQTRHLYSSYAAYVSIIRSGYAQLHLYELCNGRSIRTVFKPKRCAPFQVWEACKSILYGAVCFRVFIWYQGEGLVCTVHCSCSDGDLCSGAAVEGETTAGDTFFVSGLPPKNQVSRHPAEADRAQSGLPGLSLIHI